MPWQGLSCPATIHLFRSWAICKQVQVKDHPRSFVFQIAHVRLGMRGHDLPVLERRLQKADTRNTFLKEMARITAPLLCQNCAAVVTYLWWRWSGLTQMSSSSNMQPLKWPSCGSISCPWTCKSHFYGVCKSAFYPHSSCGRKNFPQGFPMQI